MRKFRLFLCTILILLIPGCITQFIPETEEEKELLVVEGMITDQYGINKVKLTRSLSLLSKKKTKPFTGCTVMISDDLGSAYQLTESEPGTYITDPETFQGVHGRKYHLTVFTNDPVFGYYTYESSPVELQPVPIYDSVYYEKVDVDTKFGIVHGCQIYVDTHDPLDICTHYRWDFTETWEFHLPYDSAVVPNNVCWITLNSDIIRIKSTSLLSENRIHRFPLYYIPPYSDRFDVKYSILVNQYSISEQEYDYWLKVKNIAEEVGSLYDVTPATISGNVYCLDDSAQNVLGYFSVSSVYSGRYFIKDSTFIGKTDRYADCPYTRVSGSLDNVTGLNSLLWIIEFGYGPFGIPYWVLTRFQDCADCTLRGSNIEPSFWRDDEK
ncbi:MAG: DUF4249 domain-containing protein [Bacteroidales bacterium]|nr:DUF4249 domain-containing protein [Bacteroidales bacterium]